MPQLTLAHLFGQSIALALVSHGDRHPARADDDVRLPGALVDRAVGALQAAMALLHVAPELPVIYAVRHTEQGLPLSRICGVAIVFRGAHLPSSYSAVPMPCRMLARHSPSYCVLSLPADPSTVPSVTYYNLSRHPACPSIGQPTSHVKEPSHVATHLRISRAPTSGS
jgi:hypothetical protein